MDPEFATAEAQALVGRVTMLGTWTTSYIPQASNGFGVNIQLPTTAVDGQVVQPGEQFDYITAIGPVTSPPYVEGGVLIHGQIKELGAIGGGMCSSSTTLFNAAMRAGFQIDERTNHSSGQHHPRRRVLLALQEAGRDLARWALPGRSAGRDPDPGRPVSRPEARSGPIAHASADHRPDPQAVEDAQADPYGRAHS